MLDGTKPQGFLDDDFDSSTNYINEKQAHSGFSPVQEDPRSPDSTIAGSPYPSDTKVPQPIDGVFASASASASAPPPPPPQERRVCGLRRKVFWNLFALILALIVTAAVVGGVVGGLAARNTNYQPQYPASSANATSAPSLPPVQ